MLGLVAFAIPGMGIATEDPSLADLAELQSLYRQRDFFALRDRLQSISAPEKSSVETGLLKAAVQQAFNDPEGSNQTISSLLATGETEAGQVLRLRNLQLTNHLRLHRYGAALESARAILSSPAADTAPEIVTDVQGKLPLLEALEDVPPQEIDFLGPSLLALGQTKRVPLTIEGSKFQFALDTGANFSVIMRSEAQKLGLEIRPADLVISTSTAKKVLGDVTVAETVEIGKIRYRNVVFLVLPDELLTFPGGHRIPGLVGFPVVEAMGEVRFRRDNVMEIPRDPPRRALQNLALNDLEPLTQVRYRKDNLLCRLDTGASLTVFYEPFFQKYRQRIESAGHPITAKAGGVGGFQEIPAYRLQELVLTVARSGVTLRRVEVYTEPIRKPEENYLYCNVGLDVLGHLQAYIINFQDMALVLN